MTALIALHALVAAVCLVPGRRATRWAFAVAAVAPVVGVVWLAGVSSSVLSGHVRTEDFRWVPALGLNLDFRLDGWALLMGLLVFGIGALVLAYSHFYFPARDDLGRIAGLLVAFAGAMWGLVAANGLFTLFLFWELTSVISFLLIGIEDRSAAARSAATRAFLVTGGGGLAMLAGLILLGSAANHWTISGVLTHPPTGGTVNAALALVLVGAFAKSAQFPLHFWLPGAMAAPTPVSAYLHSATMVKAGLVVVARFAPVFAGYAPWRPMVVTAGAISLLLGGARALRQQDAKLVLAHGTVSQLGLLMLLLGLGTPATTYAGVALLTAHALFKASLFLNVGVVDHEAGTRDIRRLRGLLRTLPVVAAATVTAGASMAAIPPTFGFVAKENGLDALLHAQVDPWGTVTLAAVVLGSILTVAYTARLLLGLFGDRAPGTATAGAIDPSRVHRPRPGFSAAPLALAALSLLLGLLATPVGDWLAKVAGSLDPASGAFHLHLWTGPTTALALSALAWAGGALLAWSRHRRDRHTDAGLGTATALYDRAYDGLLVGSRRVTAATHSGSLPVYLGVVLVALLAGLAAALAIGGRGMLQGLPVRHSAAETALVGLTAVLTLGILTARRRFSAALLLGGAGYGLALVFMLHGAPDLALTQFLVETVVIALYLVVLTRLPERFAEPPSWAPRVVRVGIAVAVGTGMAGFAVAAAAARTAPSVGTAYSKLAVPAGGGINVVNVILVDFRGWDTLGEIAVLAMAAVGVINLAAVARREIVRRGLFPSAPMAGRPIATTSGARVAPAPPARRSIILSTTTRGLVPVLALLSVYVTFRGHNAPGGGFAGGLILAIAVALRYLADGPGPLRRLRIDPVLLMGVGLLVTATVAAWPMLSGAPPLRSSIWKVALPLVGEVKLVSSTFFDLGVYLVVVGAVVGSLRALVATDEQAGGAVVAGGPPIDPPIDPVGGPDDRDDDRGRAVGGTGAGRGAP